MQDRPSEEGLRPVQRAEHSIDTKRVHNRSYVGEIDLFAVYCPVNGRVYAVPVEDATLSDCSLRLDPTRNGQVERVRWAIDYELPA